MAEKKFKITLPEYAEKCVEFAKDPHRVQQNLLVTNQMVYLDISIEARDPQDEYYILKSLQILQEYPKIKAPFALAMGISLQLFEACLIAGVLLDDFTAKKNKRTF